MKKILIVVFYCLFFNLYIYSQGLPFTISNKGGYLILTDPSYNLDAIILLNGLDISTEISYIGTNNIEWQYTIGGSTFKSNQSSLSFMYFQG